MRARLACLVASFGVAVACGSNNKFNPNDGGTNNDATFGFDGFAPTDGNTEGGPPVDKCHVPPDDTGDNAPTCTQPPQPPNSFDPKVKWTWTAPTALGKLLRRQHGHAARRELHRRQRRRRDQPLRHPRRHRRDRRRSHLRDRHDLHARGRHREGRVHVRSLGEHRHEREPRVRRSRRRQGPRGRSRTTPQGTSSSSTTTAR